MTSRSLLTMLIAAAALVAGSAPGASAQAPPAYSVQTPTPGALYKNGPDGRYLLGGTWLFRFDAGRGRTQHFERSTSIAGWTPVTVPNAWNATDPRPTSFAGTAAWYRKDFILPASAGRPTWIVRFESVNYRSRVWLNGHAIGTHEGAYLPFEFALPSKLLKRGAVNRIAIRVDNRRKPTDFPPSGLSESGAPSGGWWNYGGLTREVYLRKVNTIDFDSVQVLPHLPCPTCPAQISYSVVLHNYSAKAQRVALLAGFAGRVVSAGSRTIKPLSSATYTRSLTVTHPVLWSPANPHLYDATLDARIGGRRVAHYSVMSGIRSITVAGGHLMLNGRPLDFRGVGLHEDSPQYGSAIDNTIRQRFITEAKDLGATAIRAHYPLHPELEELADQNGILLWSEVPVYSIKTPRLNAIRKPAVALVRNNIIANSNHPSIIVWSIANELSSKASPAQFRYIRDAVAAAHQLDPTRPVGQAVAGYPAAGCQAAYGPLQVIGLNDYFGWYVGPKGQIADGSLLPDFLDQQHRCYPAKALVVTEFGAEANRSGPVEERGTYEFQQAFVRYHLGIYASRAFLSGAIYWALEEFRVRPDWKGGNPFPNPPIHEKGLISFSGHQKPAFQDVQAAYKATQQLQ